MPQYVEVKGQTIEFPDGMSAADIEKAIKANMMDVPAAVKAGQAINQIPRQLGLTARYALEGPAEAAQIVTEPLRMGIQALTGRQAAPLGQIASSLADRLGLPSPETATEKTVGAGTRMLAGGAGFLGAAQRGANAATGVTQQVLQGMAANPTAQLAASAGAGLGSEASRQAGGNEAQQIVGGILGTVVGGLAPGAISGASARISATRAPASQIEGRITAALKENGVDFKELPKAVRDTLVADVRKATSTGAELNTEALRRLADFRATGLTPTRGTLTLDPVQITRERNLAKIGANTADDVLQGLAQTQNQNNARLIQNLNAQGAAAGNVDEAGNILASSVLNRQAALRGAEQSAWNSARSSPGYREPISAGVLSDINRALDQEALMPFLNKQISEYMAAFQTGQRPFTPQDYRNLQSMLSREVAKGGNEGAAAGLARRLLEQADIPAPISTGPAVTTPATAAAMRAEDAMGNATMDALDAVNRARAATRQAYAYEDSSPLVRSILSEGASSDPQRIAQRFIIGGTTNEARQVAQELSPQAIPQIKNAILAHLKDKALGGAADEVGNFSQSAFNRELKKIGMEKLRVFFSPEELAQLQMNARVASYMQFQPAGSAVNNSNSGALMLGQGYELLRGVAGKLPFGQQLVVDPLRNLDISLSQRQAQNVLPALRIQQQRQILPPLIAPGIAAGGLLSAPDRP